MVQTLVCMLFGSLMFVDPEGFLDKTGRMSANMHRAVDATSGWRLQFKEKPIKHPRTLVIAVRAFGGAIVAIGTLYIYSLLTGPL